MGTKLASMRRVPMHTEIMKLATTVLWQGMEGKVATNVEQVSPTLIYAEYGRAASISLSFLRFTPAAVSVTVTMKEASFGSASEAYAHASFVQRVASLASSLEHAVKEWVKSAEKGVL
jgi:hypothetical protein